MSRSGSWFRAHSSEQFPEVARIPDGDGINHDRRRERANIIVNDIIPIDRAIEELTGKIRLRLGPDAGEELLDQLKAVLAEHRGPCPVQIELRPKTQPDVQVTVRLGEQWRVAPSRKLVTALVELLGDQKNLVLSPKPAETTNGNGKRFFRRPQAAAAQKPLPMTGESYIPAPEDREASAAVTRFN